MRPSCGPQTMSLHPIRPLAVRCLSLLGLAMGLAGCGSLQVSDSFLGVITPYRIDIVQGNVVTTELAAQVKPGMSRAQVRDLLGTPMLTDIFHADRWDYVFTIKRPGTEPQRRTIVAYFESDKLSKLEAPDLPSERDFIANIAPQLRKPTPPVLSLTEEQRKALPAPARADAVAPAVTGPTRSYPPLEPV